MLAESFPKVSLQSRLSRDSYDATFGMDKCARSNYGVTLNEAIFTLLVHWQSFIKHYAWFSTFWKILKIQDAPKFLKYD